MTTSRWTVVLLVVVLTLVFYRLVRLGQEAGDLRRELRQVRARLQQSGRDNKRIERQALALKNRLRRLDLIDRASEVVQKVRRLRLRCCIRVRSIGPGFTRRFVKESIDRELGKTHVEGYVRTMNHLGLLPRSYDFISSMQEVAGEQVAGMYDPRTKQLYVRRFMPADEVVLSHEIAHALQDQHYDLRRMQGNPRDNDDRSMAVSSLVEGDATLVMERYIVETATLGRTIRLLADITQIMAMDQSSLAALPRYLRETMSRPYIDGLTFVKKLDEVGGHKLIDRAFRDPPQSSEQILHPEKYLKRENPEAVSIPDLTAVLGNAWRPCHENTMGELGIQVLLGENVLRMLSAQDAAAGWGGDRLRSYVHLKGQMLVIWRTVWDTEAEAVEARAALASWVGDREGMAPADPLPDRPGRWLRAWRRDRAQVLLGARGREVVLVDGAEDQTQGLVLLLALGL